MNDFDDDMSDYFMPHNAPKPVKWHRWLYRLAIVVLVYLLFFHDAMAKCDPKAGLAFIFAELAAAGGTGDHHIRGTMINGRIVTFEYRRGASYGITALWQEGCLLSARPISMKTVIEVFGVHIASPTPGEAM